MAASSRIVQLEVLRIWLVIVSERSSDVKDQTSVVTGVRGPRTRTSRSRASIVHVRTIPIKDMRSKFKGTMTI